MAASTDLVLMAVIGAPHGVRGEVRARSYTDDPLGLKTYSPLFDERGGRFEVLSVRSSKNVVILRLSDIDTREKAEALKGLALYVQRDRLPDETLDDDEFFQADLIGLTVVDGAGVSHGAVTAVHNFGGGDILELADVGHRSAMIPFNETAIIEIDFDRAVIVVDRMAAGLDDPAQRGPGSRKRRPPERRPVSDGEEP